MSAIDIGALLGGPPDAGGPPPPPEAGAHDNAKQNAAITSDHTGGLLDFIRQAILALQHFAEQTNDDAELAKVHKCIVALQSILADHASDRDAAMGVTPSLRHVRRTSGNY